MKRPPRSLRSLPAGTPTLAQGRAAGLTALAVRLLLDERR
jgi:hypothetical protein